MKQQRYKFAIAIILLLLLPVGILFTAITLPSYYQKTYYAELAQMYDRLYETQGKKLIVIGGSNVAFGLDVALLQDTLHEYGYDYIVCPLGLYAAVGTSAMIELSKDALQEGDIVVLAVEPTSDTMSCYFGATAFWKCCENAPQMLLKLNSSQQSASAGAYIPYFQERCSILLNGNPPNPDGVYAKSSFDENCSMIFDRTGNAMTLGCDTSSPVVLGSISIDPAFAQQVNEYCTLAQSKGSSVYFSFSPINRSALLDAENVQAYFDLCNATFCCPVISDPNRYILDSGWFYDSNFHLNSAGATLRTYRLAEDLLAQLGCDQQVKYTPPQKPASIVQITEDSADNSFFIFEPLGGGLIVSGLTAEGKQQASLTVPSVVEGKPVVGFASDALLDADLLTELTLPASIESLPNDLFTSCEKLERLVLEHTTRLCSISQHTFSGADQLRIFVPSEAYHLYRDGGGCEANTWAEHLHRIFTYG